MNVIDQMRLYKEQFNFDFEEFEADLRNYKYLTLNIRKLKEFGEDTKELELLKENHYKKINEVFSHTHINEQFRDLDLLFHLRKAEQYMFNVDVLKPEKIDKDLYWFNRNILKESFASSEVARYVGYGCHMLVDQRIKRVEKRYELDKFYLKTVR